MGHRRAQTIPSDYWVAEYQKRGALWFHDGNFRRPHALLTNGGHSDGYFNSELISENPKLLDKACGALVRLLEIAGLDTEKLNRVVGPAMGAITIAHDLARRIRNGTGRQCFRAYTEEGLFVKTHVSIGERVLCCEDVITTGKSIEKTVKAVEGALAIVEPYIATLVNRSSITEVGGRRIVALISKEMPIWKPEECPLCAEGSEAIRPKGNWERLTGIY